MCVCVCFISSGHPGSDTHIKAVPRKAKDAVSVQEAGVQEPQEDQKRALHITPTPIRASDL